MKAEMFYFSNSFLAVAPRCNARESRERERERGDGGGGAGDERARARGLLLLRESTVAAKVAHRETSAHTHTHTIRGHPCVTQAVRELVSWVRLRVETGQLVCVPGR